MEVPRLGAAAAGPHPSHSNQILNPVSEATDETSILTDIVLGSQLAEPQWELPLCDFLFFIFLFYFIIIIIFCLLAVSWAAPRGVWRFPG